MSNLLATIDRLATLINNELIPKQTKMNDLKKDFNHARTTDVDTALTYLLQHIMDRTGLTCDKLDTIGCYTAAQLVSQIRWLKDIESGQKQMQENFNQCSRELATFKAVDIKASPLEVTAVAQQIPVITTRVAQQEKAILKFIELIGHFFCRMGIQRFSMLLLLLICCTRKQTTLCSTRWTTTKKNKYHLIMIEDLVLPNMNLGTILLKKN